MNRSPAQAPLRILLASSEAQSLIGGGELAEFCTTLGMTLNTLGQDIRLVLPAYPQAMEQARELKPSARLRLPGSDTRVTVLEGQLQNGVTLYLLQLPGLFDRDGGPYRDPEGTPWSDNGRRFGLFSRAVSLLAINQAGLSWQPDLLHCAGWASALSIPLITVEWNRPATVYSLHRPEHVTLNNAQITALALPVELLKSGVLATDSAFSFEKGAVASADRLLLPSHGYRAELLQNSDRHPLSAEWKSRQTQISAIPPGLDYQRWGPTTDPFIEQHFDSASFELKRINRRRLQESLSLPVDERHLLIGYVTERVTTEEIALLTELMTAIDRLPPLHLVASVDGDREALRAIHALATSNPQYLTLKTGEDEALKHRIVASSDCLLLAASTYLSASPALAALSYGTIPIVHGTAAMREALTDATPANLLNGVANGFLYDGNRASELIEAFERVARFHDKPAIWWQKLAQHGMEQSFPASQSAPQLLELYHSAIDYPAGNRIAGHA